MNIQYFQSAWGDIKNSPGWFGKLCLLALLNFIPVFGQIVTFGYLYGWAREIAWGTHEPMPARIFANEDGKLYRRGWFVIVLTFVFMLVPYFVVSIGDALQGLGVAQTFFGQEYVSSPVWIGIGSLVSLIGALGSVFVGIMAWIGNMRIAIYDRLSSGFQFSKIWKMFRRDTGGIMRIFGMELLISLIVGIVLSVVFAILIVMVVMAGVSGLVGAGYSFESLQYMTNSQAMRMLTQFFMSAGLVGFLSVLFGMFVAFLSVVFIDMLVIRALGYWTMQFNVPLWGGQDDPMPFELVDERVEPAQPPTWSQAGSRPGSQPEPAIDPSSPYAHAQSAMSTVPEPAVAPVAPAASPVSVDTSAASSARVGSDDIIGAPIAGWSPVDASKTGISGIEAPGQGVGVPNTEVQSSESPGGEVLGGRESGVDVDPGGPMPPVVYDEPAVVGAGFIMTPAEIDELAAGASVAQEQDAVDEPTVGTQPVAMPADASAPADGVDER